VAADRILGAREAIDSVAGGATVAVGGALNVGHPMALVRELIASDVRELTLVAGFGGLEIDMIVGCGGVRRLIAAFVGAEGFPALPPAIRWATETGRIETWDIDEGILFAALRARAQHLPYATWRAGTGTSVAESPLVEQVEDERTGLPYLKVEPLPIDVALLWAEAADADGNVLRWGPDFGDEAFANAADLRIVQVEKVVETEVLARNPDRVGAWQADVIVPAPLGTYPFASNVLDDDVDLLRRYSADLQELRERSGEDWDAARAAIRRLLAVDGDENAFLAAVGVARLRELMS
jgi:glutaconate CoA-transferase subunit A